MTHNPMTDNSTNCTNMISNLSKNNSDTLERYIENNFYKDDCLDGTGMEDGGMYLKIIHWWIDGIFHIIICTFGTVANFLSIPVLLSRKLKNLFNITLAILALFDAIYTLSDLLESFTKVHYEYGKCGEIPIYQLIQMKLYPILRTIGGASMMASIYTTIIISIERYIAVSKPVNSHIGSFEIVEDDWKNALLYIMPTALFSLVFSLPRFFEAVVTTDNCSNVSGKLAKKYRISSESLGII